MLLTYNTHGDGRLYVQVAAVVSEQLHQAVCTHTGAGAEQLVGGLCHWDVTAFLSTARHSEKKLSFNYYNLHFLVNKTEIFNYIPSSWSVAESTL